MKVLFLHGFGADPNGIRPTFLTQSGHEVTHPALPDGDFGRSIQIAQQALDECGPDVVVGSSRGGAVAMKLDLDRTPLVLIAPAWRNWPTANKVAPSTVIIHSEHDDVVPIEDSRELVQLNDLTDDHLIVVGENHRMVDPSAFDALLAAIDRVGRTRPDRPQG